MNKKQISKKVQRNSLINNWHKDEKFEAYIRTIDKKKERERRDAEEKEQCKNEVPVETASDNVICDLSLKASKNSTSTKVEASNDLIDLIVKGVQAVKSLFR